jgi:hypothetical protein
VRKSLRIVAGIGLIAVGFLLALPFVPGPGIPLMILGLVILSDHFEWAKRMVEWARRKYAQVKSRSSSGRADS